MSLSVFFNCEIRESNRTVPGVIWGPEAPGSYSLIFLDELLGEGIWGVTGSSRAPF